MIPTTWQTAGLILLVTGSSITNAFTSQSNLPAFESTFRSNVPMIKKLPTTTTTTSRNLIDPISTSSTDVVDFFSSLIVSDDSSTLNSGEVTYSKLSYYTTLLTYALSFPGLWSTIKRSTTAKIKRKTYVSPGEGAGGKDQRSQAGEIMAYMKANNYEVQDAGETITFRGLVARSTSQLFFLTFCTALGLGSLALVLQIQLQDLVLPVIGKPNWFYLVLLSPYAGLYYWKSGDRVDDIKVKLSVTDDNMENEIAIEGNDEELDRFWRALDLREKGMVKVEGILDSS